MKKFFNLFKATDNWDKIDRNFAIIFANLGIVIFCLIVRILLILFPIIKLILRNFWGAMILFICAIIIWIIIFLNDRLS